MVYTLAGRLEKKNSEVPIILDGKIYERRCLKDTKQELMII
jgi:hypothetical protein